MKDLKNKGWVRLYRKIEDNDLWFLEPFTKAQAWIDLFLNANHKDGMISIRGNIIKIKRGQIGWSELTMVKRWTWSKNKVRRFLKLLETEQQIVQQKSTLTTVITINNYDNYQNDKINDTTDDTAERQQKDSRRYTNKNDKNDKNVKNDKNTSKEVQEIPCGDMDISKVYEYLKTSIGGTPDGTIKENRDYAQLLLNRFSKDYPDKLPAKLVFSLIDFGLQDSFHQKNITSFKYLFNNAQKIIATTKSKIINPKIIKLD